MLMEYEIGSQNESGGVINNSSMENFFGSSNQGSMEKLMGLLMRSIALL